MPFNPGREEGLEAVHHSQDGPHRHTDAAGRAQRLFTGSEGGAAGLPELKGGLREPGAPHRHENEGRGVEWRMLMKNYSMNYCKSEALVTAQ